MGYYDEWKNSGLPIEEFDKQWQEKSVSEDSPAPSEKESRVTDSGFDQRTIESVGESVARGEQGLSYRIIPDEEGNAQNIAISSLGSTDDQGVSPDVERALEGARGMGPARFQNAPEEGLLSRGASAVGEAAGDVASWVTSSISTAADALLPGEPVKATFDFIKEIGWDVAEDISNIADYGLKDPVAVPDWAVEVTGVKNHNTVIQDMFGQFKAAPNKGLEDPFMRFKFAVGEYVDIGDTRMLENIFRQQYPEGSLIEHDGVLFFRKTPEDKLDVVDPFVLGNGGGFSELGRDLAEFAAYIPGIIGAVYGEKVGKRLVKKAGERLLFKAPVAPLPSGVGSRSASDVLTEGGQEAINDAFGDKFLKEITRKAEAGEALQLNANKFLSNRRIAAPVTTATLGEAMTQGIAVSGFTLANEDMRAALDKTLDEIEENDGQVTEATYDFLIRAIAPTIAEESLYGAAGGYVGMRFLPGIGKRVGATAREGSGGGLIKLTPEQEDYLKIYSRIVSGDPKDIQLLAAQIVDQNPLMVNTFKYLAQFNKGFKERVARQGERIVSATKEAIEGDFNNFSENVTGALVNVRNDLRDHLFSAAQLEQMYKDPEKWENGLLDYLGTYHSMTKTAVNHAYNLFEEVSGITKDRLMLRSRGFNQAAEDALSFVSETAWKRGPDGNTFEIDANFSPEFRPFYEVIQKFKNSNPVDGAGLTDEVSYAFVASIRNDAYNTAKYYRGLGMNRHAGALETLSARATYMLQNLDESLAYTPSERVQEGIKYLREAEEMHRLKENVNVVTTFMDAFGSVGRQYNKDGTYIPTTRTSNMTIRESISNIIDVYGAGSSKGLGGWTRIEEAGYVDDVYNKLVETVGGSPHKQRLLDSAIQQKKYEMLWEAFGSQNGEKILNVLDGTPDHVKKILFREGEETSLRKIANTLTSLDGRLVERWADTLDSNIDFADKLLNLEASSVVFERLFKASFDDAGQVNELGRNLKKTIFDAAVDRASRTKEGFDKLKPDALEDELKNIFDSPLGDLYSTKEKEEAMKLIGISRKITNLDVDAGTAIAAQGAVGGATTDLLNILSGGGVTLNRIISGPVGSLVKKQAFSKLAFSPELQSMLLGEVTRPAPIKNFASILVLMDNALESISEAHTTSEWNSDDTLQAQVEASTGLTLDDLQGMGEVQDSLVPSPIIPMEEEVMEEEEESSLEEGSLPLQPLDPDSGVETEDGFIFGGRN